MNPSKFSRDTLESLSKAELIEVVLKNTKVSPNHDAKDRVLPEYLLFEALTDSINDALFIEDYDSREIVYCNQVAVDLFNVKNKSELIGQKGEKYYKKTLSAKDKSKLNEILSDQEEWKNTYRYTTKHGKEFWGFLTIKLISISGIKYHLVKLTNATEHIRKQLQINEQKRWLHAILESTDDVIWSLDTEYCLTMFNSSFEKAIKFFTGFDVVIGENVCSEKYVNFPVHYWKECYDRALRGEKFRSEFKYEKPGGKTYYLDNSFHPILDKAKNVIGVAVISRDVTEYKATQDHLQKNQRLLSEMEKLTSVGGWEYLLESKELYWTDEAYRMHELDIGTKIDRDFAINLYLPEGQKVMWTALEQLVNEGKRYDMELPRLTVKGKQFWVRTVSNIEYENNKPKRIFGAFQDITDRKIVENELIQAKQSLENALEEKDNFVSMVSHEIRTPLNAIIGMIDLLDKDISAAEKQENISVLKTASFSLLSFVNDILDFSKIQSGNLRLERVDFNVPLILKQTRQLFQHKAQDKHIKLETKVAKDVPNFVKGDPTRLQQILNNLVSNAVKFTDQGKVTLEVKTSPHIHEKKVELVIDVTDTGIGIPSDKLKEIFEPFLQADVEINRNYGGTGLGLSIVKKLVELQGGNIEVESTENKGTTFRLFLNYERGIELTEDMMVEEKKVLAPFHVLYIEDVLTNQLLMKRICALWDVNVSMASDGMEGLKKAKTKKYDIILIDLRMARMDGYETAKKIRTLKDDYYKKVPIVAVTASSLDENIDLIKQAGMNDAITKPIMQERLYEIFTKYAKVKKTNSSQQKIVKRANANGKKIFEQLDMIFQKDRESYRRTLLAIRQEFINYKEKLKSAVLVGDELEVSNIRHKIAGTSFILEHKTFYSFLKSLKNLQGLSDNKLKILLLEINNGFDELIGEFEEKIKNIEEEKSN